MASRDAILLRSESGKWTSGALIRNDPIFSALIPDLPDLPPFLVMEGAVGEIFDEQWSSYLDLKTYMEHLQIVRTGKLQTGSMDYLISGMSESRPVGFPRLVYLHQIDRLANIITMPENWEICVGVSEMTPQKERMNHILAMGRVIERMGLADKYKAYNRDGSFRNQERLIYTLIYTLPKWIEQITTVTEGGLELPEDALATRTSLNHVYWGLTRNALIRTVDLNDGGHSLAWKTVLWDDLEPLFKLFTPRSSKLVFNTCALLMGHGDTTGRSAIAPNCYINDSAIYTGEQYLPLLYRRLLDSYQNDVDPVQFGLGPILYQNAKGGNTFKTAKDTRQHLRLDLSHMVAWLHYNSLLLLPLYRERPKNNYRDGTSIPGTISLPEEDFETVVVSLGRTLGIYGLRRILLSLLFYMQKNTEPNARVELFSSLIESYVENHQGEDEEFVGVPRVNVDGLIVPVTA